MLGPDLLYSYIFPLFKFPLNTDTQYFPTDSWDVSWYIYKVARLKLLEESQALVPSVQVFPVRRTPWHTDWINEPEESDLGRSGHLPGRRLKNCWSESVSAGLILVPERIWRMAAQCFNYPLLRMPYHSLWFVKLFHFHRRRTCQ